MQITLKQDEIETAIRSYVSGQVNIVEGNDVLIDLKAGRGPEGFTATIDIVPAGTKAPAPVEKAKAPKAIPVNPGPKVAPNESKAPPAETAQDAAEAAPAGEATDGAAESQDAGDEPDPAQDAAPPATPAKSLFGNLQKPRN